MNVLLDTCALYRLSHSQLPEKAARAFGKANEAYVSTVSIWELAIKYKAGKLELPRPPAEWFAAILRHYKLTELPLRADVVCISAELPMLHRDPFDRVLVASATCHNLILLTSDRTIPSYPGITTVW